MSLNDCSEKMSTAKILEEADNLVEHIADNINAVIYFKDAEGRLIFVNQAFEELAGMGKSAIKGKTPFDFFPHDMAQLHRDNDALVMEKQQALRFEEQATGPEGVRTYVSTKFPLRNSNGKIVGVGGISTDISEWKKTQQALTDSNQKLERFVSVASHDLQEPVRTIGLLVQSLMRSDLVKDQPVLRQSLEEILRSSHRLHSFIQDLLQSSKNGAKDEILEECDFNKIVRQARENLRIMILETNTQINAEWLPKVLVNQVQFVRVFQNLISNAIKFRNDQRYPCIQIAACQKGNEWRFRVKDNGIGIAPTFQEAIFKMFKRLDNAKDIPGSGIGLNVCKEIVEARGGKIWVESEPGVGSSFFFTIPIIEVGVSNQVA